MNEIEIRQALAGLGEARRANQDAGHQIMLKISNLVPKAVQAGITKNDIARYANISLPTIYAILDEDPS